MWEARNALVALILIAWVVGALALLPSCRGRREAALLAFAGVSILVLLETLLLSAARAYTWQAVAVCWLCATGAVAVFARRRIAVGFRQAIRLDLAEIRAVDWIVAAVLGVFVVGTLAAALLYPVVNADSLTYHLPRVFFWLQNHTVARYPTPEGRQLFSSPFAEYFVLNLKALSWGSDRLVNLVQWFSYVFSILTVSLIARELGAKRRGQQVAAVLGAATPMAVLQASTTQNDLTCALWTLAFAYAVTSYAGGDRERARHWPAELALAACSFVLATATKPPAYLALAPFVVWGAWRVARRDGGKGLVAAALALGVAVVALNGPWYADNVRLGLDPLGTNAPGNERILIADRRPASVLANTAENVSMLLGTPSDRANGIVSGALRAGIRAIGADPDNAQTHATNAGPYALDSHVLNHDVGPSPLVLVLVLLGAIVVLVRAGDRPAQRRAYVIAALTALLASAAVINWNHFINRVLLGGLLLLVPVVGVTFQVLADAGFLRWRAVLVALLSLAVAWGLVVMSFDTTNRLIPPGWIPLKTSNRDLGFWNTTYEELKFKALPPSDEAAYKGIARALAERNVTELEIDQSSSNVEIYPLLDLVSARTHVFYGGPDVLFGRLGSQTPRPQAVLEIRAPGEGASGARVLWGPANGLADSFTLVRP